MTIDDKPRNPEENVAAAPVLPKLVGQRVKRREDPRLVRGRGTYVDDVKIHGLRHLAFKRSDVAHGRIRSVDTRAAAAMDGVEAVFTGAEIAGFLDPMPIGTPFPSPEHRAVAVDTVRFVGDPVAVVVARDRYAARDAADAVVVDCEPLPAVVDPEEAMTGRPAVLHADYPTNVALGPLSRGTGIRRKQPVDDTAVDEAFAAADVVVSQRMVNQRLAPNSIEARGVVAHYEAGKDEMTIWSSTQNPHILRTMVARMVGLGQDRVRAIAPEVGGGFGAKINIYGEEYVAAALSKRLDMPLKWIEDRSEAFLATVHGRDLIGYVDLAARRDGTVLGLKLRLIADIGAYNMLLTAGIPTNSMTMASATYAIPALRVSLTEVFTNKTPTDAYRGAGRPEATYFVERAMDMLARELAIDPAELRRKNFIRPGQFPFRTQAGAVYDSGDYEKTLDRALEAAGWARLEAERDAARADGRVVGLGLSMYVESCGLGPSSMVSPGGWEHSQVTVERDGRISAATGASPHGQGNETTFAQMLADQFGVPIDHVTIRHGDTAVVKQGIGTFGSRSQAVGGAALHNAGTKVKAKMARFAAFLQAHAGVARPRRTLEHRLLLSATPHNGHSNSFSTLLELLDPYRFTRGVRVRGRKELDDVMVRRLKESIRQLQDGFPRRVVERVEIAGLPDDAPELVLSRLLDEYREAREQRHRGAPGRARAAAGLLVVGLQQRLLSSIADALQPLAQLDPVRRSRFEHANEQPAARRVFYS